MRMCTVVLALAIMCVTACDGATTSEAPRLQLTRVRAIGAADDPEYSFNRIVGIARDSAGRLYVGDAGDSQVRIFSRDGGYVRDIGRAGQGPGEFVSIAGIGLISDTLYVIDRQADRISFFRLDGSLIRTQRAAAGHFGPASTVTFPMKLLHGGAAVVTPIRRAGDVDDKQFFFLTKGGSVRDTLLALDMPSSKVVFDAPGRHMAVGNPFVAAPVFRLSPSGAYAVAAVSHPADSLAPGESRIMVVEIGKAAGWTRRVREAPIVYSKEMIDSIIEEQLRPIPAGYITAAEFKSAVALPKYERPIQAGAVGDDGQVYLRRPIIGAKAEWLVIGSNGKTRGYVELPASAGHMLLAGDTVFVVELNEFDVPFVVEYRVGRRE